MPNIFISHSSADKPFVKRLAHGLLSEGLPVWLDAWQLEYGDSLTDKIYEGIEESSIVLLVVSRQSAESGWVNRELNAALAMEAQVRRKFLIPLKLEDCPLPLKVADRLYIDFSSGFSSSLAQLVEFFARQGARELPVDPGRELLSLTFTQAVHLDMASFSRGASHIRKRQGRLQLRDSQIVVATDLEYDQLMNGLHRRIDNIAADPFFSPELERHLRLTLSSVKDDEHRLRQGVALLASNIYDPDAVYWFSRIVRGRIVYKLWSAQAPGAPDLLEYGSQWSCACLMSGFEAANVFQVPEVCPADLSAPTIGRPGYFHLLMASDDLRSLRDDHGRYEGAGAVLDTCSPSVLSKYVLPQIVLQHLELGRGPIPWDFVDATIGIS